MQIRPTSHKQARHVSVPFWVDPNLISILADDRDTEKSRPVKDLQHFPYLPELKRTWLEAAIILTTPKVLLQLETCRLIDNFACNVFAEERWVLLCQRGPEHAMLFGDSTENNVWLMRFTTNALATRAFLGQE
jgi:hypothetical protein